MQLETFQAQMKGVGGSKNQFVVLSVSILRVNALPSQKRYLLIVGRYLGYEQDH